MTLFAKIIIDEKIQKLKIQPEDQCVLTVDPINLARVLQKSNIQNAWGPWSKLQTYLLSGAYFSVSVQFHWQSELHPLAKDPFDAIDPYKITEWGIITLKLPFLDPNGAHILSTTILDLEAYSTRLKKIVRKCTKEEIIQEVRLQLNLPVEFDRWATTGHWVSQNGELIFETSSRSDTILGPLEPLGSPEIAKNVALVGCINPHNFPPTTMEAAVETGLRFGGEPLKKQFRVTSILNIFFFILALLWIL
jgi:hypothetical protein